MTSSSPTAQVASFSRLPCHASLCRLNLSETPAQVGQSSLSPDLAPAGTSRARPHSGQKTVAPIAGLPPAPDLPPQSPEKLGRTDSSVEHSVLRRPDHSPLPPMSLRILEELPKQHPAKPVALIN